MNTDITKALATMLFALAGAIGVHATESDSPTVDISMDTRADYTLEDIEKGGTQSGIHGRYLNLIVDGAINPSLTYHWRQRMNKYKDTENDIFTATDWIYLDYRINPNFSIAGGKQVVLIGGYEYDAAPIDIFFASRFWNNIACYQFGGSASYHSDNGKHTITAQVTNSPYQGMSSSCYAYNLYWSGNMGCFSTLWSVNLIEYEKGHYANFIALGNHLALGDLDLQLDIMNRATSRHKYWFADYSLIAKAEYKVTPWMTLMAKGGKDDFRAVPGSDAHQDNPFYGGGFEFYPLHGSPNLRIHAIADVYHDNDGIRTTEINIGLKWKVNLYSKH